MVGWCDLDTFWRAPLQNLNLVTKMGAFGLQCGSGSERVDELSNHYFDNGEHGIGIAAPHANAQHFSRNLYFEKGQGCSHFAVKWFG